MFLLCYILFILSDSSLSFPVSMVGVEVNGDEKEDRDRVAGLRLSDSMVKPFIITR